MEAEAVCEALRFLPDWTELFIKENPTRYKNVLQFLLFPIYVKFDMFRATHRPSSGA
jgi:hypothetical protein